MPYWDPDLTMREEVHAALVRWAAAQNVTGEVQAFSIGFPAEFHDDPPLDPVPVHEGPAAALRQMLDAGLAARAGLPPGDEDPLEGIGYAAARLKYLLGEGLARAGGWPQPVDAAEALGELARLAELIAMLAAKADDRLGRELRAGRVTPIPSAGGTGRTAPPADVADRVHDSAVAAMAGLGEAVAQLRRMQMRAGDLQRTMRAAVAGTADGPTLRSQYLVRCRPNGWQGAYHVRVFAPPRGRRVVVIGELADNHSTHLNNCMEALAPAVAEHLLGTRDADAVTWVQYGPAEEWYSAYERDAGPDAEPRDREDEIFTLGFAPGFSEWTSKRPTSPDELEQLAGGPVRRWHAYDYTIAAVTAAGAQPVDIDAPRRPR